MQHDEGTTFGQYAEAVTELRNAAVRAQWAWDNLAGYEADAADECYPATLPANATLVHEIVRWAAEVQTALRDSEEATR